MKGCNQLILSPLKPAFFKNYLMRISLDSNNFWQHFWCLHNIPSEEYTAVCWVYCSFRVFGYFVFPFFSLMLMLCWVILYMNFYLQSDHSLDRFSKEWLKRYNCFLTHNYTLGSCFLEIGTSLHSYLQRQQSNMHSYKLLGENERGTVNLTWLFQFTVIDD